MAAAVYVALVLVVAGMLSRIGNGGGIFNFLMTGQSESGPGQNHPSNIK